MLGPDPCWDQMQNSKNAHLHAKIQCWTPFVLLNHLISLHIVLVSLTKNLHSNLMGRRVVVRARPCYGTEFVVVVKNKLQIPQNHKNRPNVPSGFQVLYPSVIVIRYVMLCPLLWLGPLCCVRQTISHVTPRKLHCLPEFHNDTAETKKT